jgi:hypothetical protein
VVTSHSRFAPFGELEHAGEVLERRDFIGIGEPWVHRGCATPRLRSRCRSSDRGHESLLFALEESGVALVDGEDPVGAKRCCHLLFFVLADEFADPATRPVQP